MALKLEAVVVMNKGAFDSGLGAMGRQVSNVAGAMAFAFGGVAGEIMMMTRAFGPMGAAVMVLKQAVAVGQEFQYAMANVATVTGLVGEELASVSQEARRFAETTAFTATEAADALYALGSAGFSSAGQLKDMLTPALELAGATQADTKIATEAMTTTLNAFRMETGKSAEVADLFAGAIANSPANMSRLGEALGQANPVAAAFNMNLSDTVESLAAFHKVGIMGSEAGTAFRQALTKLNQEMGDADSVIGQALQGWQPSIEGLTGAIRRMEDAGITGADAMTELGIRGGKAVAAQLALGSDAISKLGDKIIATGDVTEMYATQMNTVHNQWKVFLSMIQENGLRVWDLIKDDVLKMILAMQQGVVAVRAFAESFKDVKTPQEAMGKIVEAIKAGVETINKALQKIDWAPLMSFINAGLDAIVGALRGIDWDSIGRDMVGGAVTAILAGLNVLRGVITEKITDAYAGIDWGAIGSSIKASASSMMNGLVNAILEVGPALRSGWFAMFSGLSDVMQNIDFGAMGTILVKGMRDANMMAANALRSFFANDMTQIAISGIGEMFGTMVRAVFEYIGAFYADIEGTQSSFVALVSAIGGATFDAMRALVEGFVQGLFGADITDRIGEAFAMWMLGAKLKVQEGMAAITETMIEQVADLAAILQSPIDSIAAAFGSAEAIAALESDAKKMADAMSAPLDAVKEGVEETKRAIADMDKMISDSATAGATAPVAPSTTGTSVLDKPLDIPAEAIQIDLADPNIAKLATAAAQLVQMKGVLWA